MSFEQYLKELIMPASHLAPMAVEEDRPKGKGSNDAKIKPSDEEIEKVAESAEDAYWKVVVEAFKDKLESKEFKPSEEMATFKKIQHEVIKQWINDNWDKDEDVKINHTPSIEIKPSSKSFEPPGTPGASGEARI